MLEKEPGSPRIHRLRAIHIYEADYNLMLAVKWREAMYNAEDQRLLHADAYGSRPGCSAHDPIALEVAQRYLSNIHETRGQPRPRCNIMQLKVIELGWLFSVVRLCVECCVAMQQDVVRMPWQFGEGMKVFKKYVRKNLRYVASAV